MSVKCKLLLLYFVFTSLTILDADILIQNVIFQGNNQITDTELRRSIRTKAGDEFDQKTINEDVQLIQQLYISHDIYNVKVSTPLIQPQVNSEIIVIFPLQESENMIINELLISGNSYLKTEIIENQIRTENLTISELPGKLVDIIDLYNSKGFLFAEAVLDSIRKSDSGFQAYIKIEEGKFCRLKEVVIKGNNVSTSTSLLKITQLSKYPVINPDLLQQANDRILKKAYIKNSRIIMLDPERLLIDVEEDRMTLFSGILGYNNSLSDSRKLNGYLEIDFLNLFGTDRSLEFFWQKLTSDRTYLELSYHEAGPVNIPVSGDLLINREEVDSTYIRTGLNTELYYSTLSSKYGLSITLSSIYPGSRRPKLVSHQSLTKIGLFWEYSSILNSGNPVAGNYVQAGYYNVFYDNDSRQQTEVFWQTFFNPFPKNVIAFKVNSKAVENKDLEDYDLFTLGGLSNLRGYNEDQFHGFWVIWTNLEYRYLLSLNSRAFVFVDYGYAESSEQVNGRLFSVGLGLRLNTKLGIIGIDYGLGYENEKLRNPLDGIIHFGIETKL